MTINSKGGKKDFMPNHLKWKIGDKVGLLTIISRAPSRSGKTFWYCNCECGTKNYEISTKALSAITKKPHNCGCLNLIQISELGKKQFEDLSGQTFGKLLVLKPTEFRSAEAVVYECQCACGAIINVRSTSLRSGHTQSCGCLKSTGEFKISSLLSDNNISFEKEYIFKDFKYPDSFGIPRFDFLVKGTYVIEYDGLTHYETNGGWNTKNNLQIIQKHDELKNQFCIDNNIPLIRIPYWAYNDLQIQDLLLETSKYVYTKEVE